MAPQPPSSLFAAPRILPIATLALTIAVFVLDSITPVEVAVSVLYAPLVVLAARFCRPRTVVLFALVCAVLTVASHFLSPGEPWTSTAVLDRLFGLCAIGLTALLVVKNQSADLALRDQAQLLDLSHDAIFVRDVNGVILYWNNGAEELYGWKQREALGKVAQELLHTIFPVPLEDMMTTLHRSSRWEGELVHTKRDGTQVVVASRWSVQRDDQGRFVGVLASNTDITERKRAEDALRKSEDNLRLVIDTVPAFIWSTRPDGALDFINRQWTEMGLSLDDMQGSNWTHLIHPDDRTAIADKWDAAVTAGEPYENVERLGGADGEYRWFLSRARPLRDERGNVVRWYGVDTDISNQKRAEGSLREQAELLDLTHDTIFVRDENDVITYWNRGAEELYGWRREEAVGKVTHELLHTAFPEPHEEIRATLLRTGRWDGELTHTKRDGTQVVVASRWSVQRDDRGRPVGTLETNNDITERRRAEESIQRQANLLEQTHDAVMVWELSGPIIYWNRGAEQLYGFARQDAIGRRSHDLLRTEHPMPTDLFEATIERDGTWTGELTHTTRDGRKVIVDSRHVLVREPDGSRFVIETNRDITERKRAEQVEQRLSAIVESSDDAIVSKDLDGIIATWNRGAERLFGYAAEEVIGKPVTILIPPERHDEEPGILARIRRGEPVDDYETVRRRKDGSLVEVSLSVSPIRNTEGRIIGASKIAHDITERKLAEEALRRSEAYLAEAQKLSKTGSFSWAVPHGDRYWSDECYRIYGYDRSVPPTFDMITRRIHPDDREYTRQIIERAYKEGNDFDYENRLLMPDGSVKYLHIVARATRDKAGTLEFMGAIMDVTDNKRALEELQRTQGELARVTRLTTMGQLAASIAHEVNQPLTGVVSNGHTCLHWLEDENLDLAKARVAAQRIMRDGQRASDVIGRIRSLMTKSAPQASEVDMNEVIGEVLALTQSELRTRQVSVETELAVALPPVIGDQVQLQQVLMNLVINGIDAMVPVTDRPRVLHLGSRLETGSEALVFVRDHGTGLDPEAAEKIFDAFFTTKSQGIGMGLAICRSIVEAHGGRLWASPAKPHGAVFQFTVPTNAARNS